MKFKSFAGVSILILLLSLSSCGGGYNGQLLGVQNRPSWRPEMPFGMVYIPSGKLHIGPSDQDINNGMMARSKSISISGFYMDDQEISNNEYRQFVEYVKDSIAHTLLDHIIVNDETGNESIDWKEKIEWGEQETVELLEAMYLPKDDPLGGGVDVSQLNFKYVWIDMKTAAREAGVDREDILMEEETNIYPDTLVWIRDFSYSYNEPFARNYYKHPAFDDYPVVGIGWDQANAFCAWRTALWNNYKSSVKQPMMDDFRLPIEHEWEYAARGGKKMAPYPWGGPYIRNAKGCLLANFKPGRGNYPEDGGLYTVRTDSYWPNDYGLYNMAGNVAEWTSSAFYENSYSFLHDLNPDIRYDANDSEPNTMKRKVLRGGSWKDIGYFIQNGTRHWEYSFEKKSYIGFRSVSTYLGRDFRDNSF